MKRYSDIIKCVLGHSRTYAHQSQPARHTWNCESDYFRQLQALISTLDPVSTYNVVVSLEDLPGAEKQCCANRLKPRYFVKNTVVDIAQ